MAPSVPPDPLREQGRDPDPAPKEAGASTFLAWLTVNISSSRVELPFGIKLHGLAAIVVSIVFAGLYAFDKLMP